MRFPLDTNVLSELSRERRNRGVVDWFTSLAVEDVFISVLTMGELLRGTMKLPAGRRRTAVETANAALLTEYADGVLTVDQPIVTRWAEISARNIASGVNKDAIDELIAATAIVHDLAVATRNIADFQSTGCRLLSPWSD